VRDAWLVPLINCGTSFLAGLVVFSVLGFMATEAGIGVEELQMQGSGLAFVAYPQAIAQMPAGQLFAVLFFVMVICLGVDSQFAMVETVLTALNDAGIMSSWSKPRKSALTCTLMGLIGLIFVTRAGMHWLELFDSFAVNMTLFCCGALECVAVGWVYGTDRFAADTLEMTGRKLPKPLLYMYKFVIPAILGALAISTLYASIVSKYPFPPGGIVFGWMISITAMVPIFYCLLADLWRGLRRRREAASNLRIKARTVVARSLPPEVQLSSVLSDVAGVSSAGGVQLRGQVV